MRQLSKKELFALEPHIAPSCVGAVHIPGETIVDSWLIAASYNHEAVASGLCTVVTGARVTGAVMRSDSTPRHAPWTLETTKGSFEVDAVINCGGEGLTCRKGQSSCRWRCILNAAVYRF